MAMGDFEPVKKIFQLDLPSAEREQILGGNAAAALKLDTDMRDDLSG